jgi:hypothetical protein
MATWTSICAGSSTPRAHDNYRVILKLDEGEFEIGSIGIQHDGDWSWGIDNIPMRAWETQGEGKDARSNSRPPGSGLPPTRPT